MSLVRLAPFLATTLLYWVWFIPTSQPSLTAMILKVLPTLCLAWAANQGEGPSSKYKEGIAIGLVISALGDALLVWDSFFVFGILAFGCAHVRYIRALVYRPWPGPEPVFTSSVGFGIPLFGVAGLIWFFGLRDGLAATGDLPLTVGVPLYICLLTCTVWRSGVDGDWMMLLGAGLFLFSDLCIGINLFVAVLPASQIIIMSTYYVGQMFITLSAILEEDLKKIE